MTKITVDAASLAAMISQAVAAALAASAPVNAGKPAAKVTAKVAKPALVDGKTERSIQNEIAVVKAFKKAGFGTVTPHGDVMTYNRWLAKGFKVKAGEHALKVKNLRLFHKTQVEAITLEEKAAIAASMSKAVEAAGIAA